MPTLRIPKLESRLLWSITLGSLCFSLLTTTATGQTCSCDPHIPDGLEVIAKFMIEDGSPPELLAGFQNAPQQDVSHANRFIFSTSTTITHVCIALGRQNLEGDQAVLRVRSEATDGDPGAVLSQIAFTVTPVQDHQIVELASPIELSGVTWFEVEYRDAKPGLGFGHQGINPSNVSQSKVLFETGDWVSYDTWAPGYRAVIRPMHLERIPCHIKIENISGNETDETGGQMTFQVHLQGSPPQANVVLDISSSDETEGTVFPTRLTFTPSNWQTPRTVTVTGVDDLIVDGDRNYQVRFANSQSTDPCWDGKKIPSIQLVNRDDDRAVHIELLTAAETSEDGQIVSFRVSLQGTPPLHSVLVRFTSSDTTEGALAGDRATFEPSDWTQPVLITLRGVDDGFLDGDIPYRIEFQPTSSGDPAWQGLATDPLQIVNRDDEEPIVCSPVEVDQLLASDAMPSDQLGRPLALSGRWAMLGSYFNDGEFQQAGAAYAFEWDGQRWVERAKLRAVPQHEEDRFADSLDISGRRAVFGVRRDDDDGTRSGAVFVYEYDGEAWGNPVKLKASDAGPNRDYGWSVAVSGTTVLVGAVKAVDVNWVPTGALYFYDWDGQSWQETKLVTSDAERGDWIGQFIAISGDQAVAGVPDKGAAYVFERINGVWTETQKIPSREEHPSGYGHAVAIGGDWLMIGSSGGGVLRAGFVDVYEYQAGIWAYRQTLEPSDGFPGDGFSTGLSLRGARAVIGAPLRDEAGLHSGAAYVFEYDGQQWVETGKIAPSLAQEDDWSGRSVGISQDRILIGAHQSDAAGLNAGIVYAADASLPFVAYGDGAPGTKDIVPELTGAGCPTLGSAVTLLVADGLGGASGTLWMGFERAELPALGGTLLVEPFVPLPISLGGTPGLPATGTARLPLALPSDTRLLGLKVTMQALLLDPGAPRGLSMTNGLEVRFTQ